MPLQQSRRAPLFIGGIIAVASFVSVTLGFLLLTGIMKPPKAWGPKPWGAEAREARQLIKDFGTMSAATNRLRAVERVLAVRSPEAIYDIQAKAFLDTSPEVRAAAVLGLLDCLTNSPGLLVKRNMLRMRVGSYVRMDMIQKMGEEDSSPDVRIAVARFWQEARDFSPEAQKRLQEMATKTTDTRAQQAVRAGLDTLKSR